MRTLRTMLSALILVALLPSATQAEFLTRSVTIEGTSYAYQVHVPPGWTPKQQWPVVVYLHGADARGSDGKAHLAEGFRTHRTGVLESDGARYSAVYVFPQARPNTSWGFATMQEMALAQLDAAIDEFKGIPIGSISSAPPWAARGSSGWPLDRQSVSRRSSMSLAKWCSDRTCPSAWSRRTDERTCS